MKKAFEYKVGDKIIYRRLYDIVESEVVKEPIDNEERPKFKMGRIDLANGDYLIGGTEVYESMEEAKKDVLELIDCAIEKEETKITIAKGMLLMLKNKKEKLNNK